MKAWARKTNTLRAAALALLLALAAAFAAAPAGQAMADNSVPLIARWAAKTYTVTLDKQGGEGGPASVEATFDAAMPAATMPTRTGYAFDGYWDAAAGGTQYYGAGGESVRAWDKAEDATLHARWIPYTISSDPDDTGGADYVARGASEAGNVTFTIPTQVVYLMRADGTLEQQDEALLANETADADLHVSGMKVAAESGWTLVGSDAFAGAAGDNVATVLIANGAAGSASSLTASTKGAMDAAGYLGAKRGVANVSAGGSEWNLARKAGGTGGSCRIVSAGRMKNVTADVTAATGFARVTWYVTAGLN